MRATFRFYGPLNDFLPSRLSQRDVPFTSRTSTSVKDALESLGPPHVEVTHLLVDGRASSFDRLLEDGARVAAYPEAPAFAGLARTAPPAPRPRRFLLDVHLHRLAVSLRLLGFEAAWSAVADDADLAQRAASGPRILLSRDLGLLKRSAVVHGRFVRATDPRDQLVEIADAYDLRAEARPFSRCTRCSTLLRDVAKEDVLHRLESGTRETYLHFRACPACGQVFWRGAHAARLVALVRRVLPGWRDPEPAGGQA